MLGVAIFYTEDAFLIILPALGIILTLYFNEAIFPIPVEGRTFFKL